ncbi:hypothetical protein AVEN_184424-1, partial [Araneus ventricosus]
GICDVESAMEMCGGVKAVPWVMFGVLVVRYLWWSGKCVVKSDGSWEMRDGVGNVLWSWEMLGGEKFAVVVDIVWWSLDIMWSENVSWA